MSRIKAVGVYERDDYRPVEVFSTKNKALTFMTDYSVSTGQSDVYAEFFYYLTPEQLSTLSYAQARDLEMILEFATLEMSRENNY
jgi:hypothetical protein